jgi:hypothetical protein
MIMPDCYVNKEKMHDAFEWLEIRCGRVGKDWEMIIAGDRAAVYFRWVPTYIVTQFKKAFTE